jgi:UDP-GlcNAc:undecaprenyl-phosphate/decaprenyl-phosphate GlcNAc-1-phosphate transferase
MSILEFLPIFLLATPSGLLGTWAARLLARRWGIVNKPNPIVPQHTQPIAYLGGLGIAIGIVLTTSIMMNSTWFPTFDIPIKFTLPCLFFLGLGIWDDLQNLSPFPKICLQTIASGLAVAMGNQCSYTGIVILDNIISVFWIMTLVNAFNFTDVCDGLVGGLGAITMLFLAYLMPDNSLLPLAFAGSCLGFLTFNWPPASIFMGDAGTHLLGFAIASLTLTLEQKGGLWIQMAQAALLTGVPLFELAFISAVRIDKGLPWWKGSPDHFSLRLQQAGFSRIQTDSIAWSVAILLGLGAVFLNYSLSLEQGIFFIGLFIITTFFTRFLLKWDVC